MQKYKALIGSATQAINAQRILTGASIRSEVVKISSVGARRGCSFGIEFPSEQYNNVVYLLNKYGIRVTKYLTSDGV